MAFSASMFRLNIRRLSTMTLFIIFFSYYLYYYYSAYWYEIFVINFQFPEEEREEDVLLDIDYSKKFLRSPAAFEAKDESDRIQRLQYEKQAKLRTEGLLHRSNLYEIQAIYMAQVQCPKVVRLGHIGDGEYVLCSPWVLKNSKNRCIVYSLGVRQNVDFEQDLYDISNQNCDIFCFDEHEEQPELFRPFRGTFMKVTVSDKTDQSENRYSLLDITKKFGHKDLDILKLDIEAGELTVLPRFIRQFNGTVCQLIMEMHSWSVNPHRIIWVRTFRMLERRGYRLFHAEPTPGDSRCFVYSYIHLNCFERFGLSPSDVLFTYFV